jgi:hypothetical protein
MWFFKVPLLFDLPSYITMSTSTDDFRCVPLMEAQLPLHEFNCHCTYDHTINGRDSLHLKPFSHLDFRWGEWTVSRFSHLYSMPFGKMPKSKCRRRGKRIASHHPSVISLTSFPVTCVNYWRTSNATCGRLRAVCRRKRSWPIVKHYDNIRVKIIRQTTIDFSQYSVDGVSKSFRTESITK